MSYVRPIGTSVDERRISMPARGASYVVMSIVKRSIVSHIVVANLCDKGGHFL